MEAPRGGPFPAGDVDRMGRASCMPAVLMLDPTASFVPHTHPSPEASDWSPTRRRFAAEVAASALKAGPVTPVLVTAEDLAGLPETARRYLDFMGVAAGRPRDWSFRLGWTGQFRRGPHQDWKKCEAWQLTTSVDVARIFVMRIRLGGLPVVGRDTYVRGHGRMLIRPFDLFTIEDAVGPELDIGELVTYLNDAVFFAPSMLLGSNVTWSPVDEVSFSVALTDEGRTVRARVFVDDRGAPVDFSTTDRFWEDTTKAGHPLVRARWTTPMDGWTVVAGRPVPTSGRAIWHMPQGAFTYVELQPIADSLAFNLAPSEV